jgi:hypothetical protein
MFMTPLLRWKGMLFIVMDNNAISRKMHRMISAVSVWVRTHRWLSSGKEREWRRHTHNRQVGFISRIPRHLGMVLGVIEALCDIKRELVRRPYRWLLLCEAGHRHRHQILSCLSSSIVASKSVNEYLGEG